MIYIEKHKKDLNDIFGDVRDIIKVIGDKQSFELSLNEITIDCIMSHKSESIDEK